MHEPVPTAVSQHGSKLSSLKSSLFGKTQKHHSELDNNSQSALPSGTSHTDCVSDDNNNMLDQSATLINGLADSENNGIHSLHRFTRVSASS